MWVFLIIFWKKIITYNESPSFFQRSVTLSYKCLLIGSLTNTLACPDNIICFIAEGRSGEIHHLERYFFRKQVLISIFRCKLYLFLTQRNTNDLCVFHSVQVK